MKLSVSKQFLAFLVSGGLAALANFGSRIVFNRWFSFSTSIIFGYLVGMLTAFVLMKQFVFSGSRKSLKHSIFVFTLVNLAAVAQTWAVSMVLAYYVLPWLGIHHFVREIAHACGIAVPVFNSYIGHKRWTF
ncbi:MAG TPA: GtrA family protein [Pyrinomonadaceae bacterium]|jgi:putative flippase GtrA|nr:GtrA family protein [Pyrinomonadaceae bacterium]